MIPKQYKIQDRIQVPGESGDYSSRGIQWGWNPVGGGTDPYNLTPDDLVATGVIGEVTVSTT